MAGGVRTVLVADSSLVRLCKISAGTENTVKSIIEQICSKLHCHSSTGSFPSPEQWLSQQEMCLVPSCTLWSGSPDLNNACLLPAVSGKPNDYSDQLFSQPKGYTLLVIPKVLYQESTQSQVDPVVKETPDELMEPYNASLGYQQEALVLEPHPWSQLTSDGPHQFPRLTKQEIERQLMDEGTKHKVEQLVRDKEHVRIEERVSETEVEDVGEDGGTNTCLQMKKQGILPNLEHLLMLRTLSPEVSSSKLAAVEKEIQKESESDCILVGEESTIKLSSVEVECITPKHGDSDLQRLKHDSVSPGRHSQSPTKYYDVDSDSDKDLPCVGITSNHKVSPSHLPTPQSRTTFSSTSHTYSTKDIIVISGSEDESVKLKYHEKSLSSSLRDSLKEVGAMSPSSLKGESECGSNFLGSLEESRDEGIVMEESISSNGDDVMLDIETEVGLRDEQIVSVLKAELQKSPSSHWSVSRAMRQLKRVFGEAVATKVCLVQRKLQELQSSQVWVKLQELQSSQVWVLPVASFKCCGMEITQNDLDTLLPGKWLNDQVINCYMRLLMENFGRKVYIVSTFFYTKLCATGFEGVQRWLKKVDLFHLRLLLIPIHLGDHWCLAAINFKRKKIEYFDSLGRRNRTCLKFLYYILKQNEIMLNLTETARIGRSGNKAMTFPLLPVICTCTHYIDQRLVVFLLKFALQRDYEVKNGWKRCYPKGIPHQHNYSDCGVFACQTWPWKAWKIIPKESLPGGFAAHSSGFVPGFRFIRSTCHKLEQPWPMN